MGKDALYSTAHGMQFTTKDQDNDLVSNGNCATTHGNGGNWYNKCFVQNLNGQYQVAKDAPCTFVWMRCMTAHGNSRSQLKSSKMMIRPKN